MKVCIIGAGVVGCAVAYELGRRDCDVVVIDRLGDAGHGSTSGCCGIVRRFYSHPDMIAVAQESTLIWADWATYLGPIDDEPAVFERPGMLFIPPAIDDGVREIVGNMRDLDIPVDLLTADEVSERFPFLDVTSQFPPRPVDDESFFDSSERKIAGGVFEVDAGFVTSPGLATLNLRRAAERESVRFRMNSEVTGIRSLDDRGFRVEVAGKDSFEADVVVNVGGPHSSRINALAGVELPLETRALRREVHAVSNPLLAAGPGRSALPIVGDLDSGVYFRPEAGGRDLIVGTMDPQCDPPEWVDPDDYNVETTELYRQRHCLRLMKRFPEVRLGPDRGLAALYDVTVRDWYPIADRTDLPGYYVCIGTSGSSFKTAPTLGRLMAETIDAVENGRDTDRDPIRLKLPRAGTEVDAGFLSRLRGKIRTTGTVIG